MPENSRSSRRLPDDDKPNLGTKALMRQLEELATAKGLVNARVAYKRNAKDEHVVALIFEGFKRS
jgi:hypothetical protein